MKYFKHSILTLLFLLLIVCMASAHQSKDSTTTAPAIQKPRIVITTDPELDDMNSLIRLFLNSTDYRIEGLIYTSSGFHWKGDGKGDKWYGTAREYWT